MAKTLTTGRASNKSQQIMIRSWKFDQKVKTSDTAHNSIVLKRDDIDQVSLLLNLKHWESFVIFLAESFAQAELEASGNTGEFEITLTVERK